MVGLIETKKGTIRANHYHPQQEQKCLFTKGQIIEIFQDILNPNSPKNYASSECRTNFSHKTKCCTHNGFYKRYYIF